MTILKVYQLFHSVKLNLFFNLHLIIILTAFWHSKEYRKMLCKCKDQQWEKIINYMCIFFLMICGVWGTDSDVNDPNPLLQVLTSFIYISKFPLVTFHPPQHVNWTLNESPSCLGTNCPHKCSFNLSHNFLLFTCCFSSQGHPKAEIKLPSWLLLLHPGDSLCSQCLLPHPVKLFFSLCSERCLEP